MNRSLPIWGLAMGIGLATLSARAELVLDDPLQGSTIGTFNGGTGQFVTGGWKITGKADSIYWHLPYTVYKGAVEFSVRGLNPTECRPGLTDKCELFHMYDYTYESADTNYGGYRNNPFKHFIRKTGCDGSYNNTINALELVLVIAPNYQEPDSRVLDWNSSTTYVFREEWGPDGHGNCVFKTYRDGNLEKTMSEPGSWSPVGHSVRIARARMDEWSGAPLDAVFSNVKVWDLETTIPTAPIVTYPGVGFTVNTRTPRIQWAWTPTFNRYQVRITSGNSPTTGVVWDSGAVMSVRNYADTASLANLTNYYAWLKLGNGAGWTDWSATNQWFRVDTSYSPPNHGMTRLDGNTLQDNEGPFLGLGFTYMEALGFCRNDRDRFESDLAFMSSRGFNYMRILSEVPAADDLDYWWGRAINASTYTCPHGAVATEWSDYDQQFRDMVDIAYDKYGVRTEVTVFGGAGDSFPSYFEREEHCQRILDLIVGREHKIVFIEVANEGWQTGFPYPQGVADMRSLCKYLADRTAVPVAISATPWNYPNPNATLTELYSGSAADIATEHFERNLGTFEGGWLPVRDCWRAEQASGVPPVSSDEPIGPGSSVASEGDPIKLVSAACFAWIAKLPAYVYHCRAGVRGDYRFEDHAGVNDYRYLSGILPSDMPNWARNDGKEVAAPFTVHCDGYANQYWTDPGRSGATTGCHRNIGGIKCTQFVCYPQGILSGGVTLRAKRDMTFDVYNPLTGSVVMTRTLATNQSLVLPQGPGAYIIKGTFPGSDTAPPGPVVKFAVNSGDTQNVLTWRNPSDADYWDTKIVYRTDRYPSSASDGTVVCEKTGSPGTSGEHTHTGLTNRVTCYYAAIAYDCAANDSTVVTAAGTPAENRCMSDSFTYPDGNLNGNDSWSGSATSQIQVIDDTVVVHGGAATYHAARGTFCQGSGTGYITTRIRVQRGIGDATLWGLWFDDPAGNNLARWYGKGTTARGRIAGTSEVTAEQVLTGGWDSLVVKIDPAADTSEFIFNGTSIGTLDHSVTGASDTLGRIWFECIGNGNATGHYVYMDGLIVGERMMPGDFDDDEDVDQADFGRFQGCLSKEGGPYPQGCDDADLDADHDVDGRDFLIFQSCLSSPGQPSACAD